MKKDFTVRAEDFAYAAKIYCEIIDCHNTYSKENFLCELAKALSALYHTGLMLPDVEPDNDEAIDDYGSSIDRERLNQEIASKLGDFNFYWEIYNPYDLKEPVAGSIGDDVADIYVDLRIGLEVYKNETNAEMIEAIWHWRFSFYTHISNHIVDVLRAINRIIMHE